MIATQRIERIVRGLEGPLPGDEAKAAMWPRPFGLRPDPGDDFRRAAVLILLFPEAGEVRFPLMRRRENAADVHSGQISLPGGQWERGETLRETALRETEEELGIDPARVEIVGELSPHRIPVSAFEVLPVVGVTTGRPAMKPDPTEVESILVTSVEDLEGPRYRATFERTLSGRSVHIPCWRLEGGVLWGATAMILAELLSLAAAVDVD